MWPNGQRRPPSVPRTEEQKLKTKEDAYLKLSALMPGADGSLPLLGLHMELTLSLSLLAADVAANMIGRRNARRGAKRLFAVLQNPRLNAHLVHTILDEVSPLVSGLTWCAL
jgi:sorting nexin-25